MLEDGFDAETAARTSSNRDRRMAFGRDDDGENEYDMMVDKDDEGSDDDEIEMEEADNSGEEADSDDEEISTDEDSGVTEEIDEDSEAETDEDDDDDGSEESQDEGIDEEFEDEVEDQENAGWDEDNTDDFLDGNVEDDDVNDGGGIMGQGESDLDEGWTRIESSGFGGMLMGTVSWSWRTLRLKLLSASARYIRTIWQELLCKSRAMLILWIVS